MSTKIFLASSYELKTDRAAFRELIMEQNNAWHEQGAFLQVVGWEHFLDAVSGTRLQDEYNKAIRDCDVFVMLFHTKVGPYTREEFEAAHAQFLATGSPQLYTYFKTTPPDKAVSAEDRQSLSDFQTHLSAMGHFVTRYESLEGLQLHFLKQLNRLADEGVIDFAPPDGAPPEPANINASDGSTVANGLHATAVAQGGVVVGGDNAAPINTGTQIHTDGGAYVGGSVCVEGGDFVGRDRKPEGSKD